MEQLGNYFLAGAMLAGDENIGIRRANLTNQLKHGLHGGSASDKLGHAFSAEEAIFKFELTGATQSMMQLGVNANERDQALILPRLLDEVACAALDGFDGQVNVAPGGHDDDWNARIHLVDAGEEIEAFLAGGGVARVVKVDEYDVVVVLADRIEEQLWRANTADVDALRGQKQLDSLENVGLIVGDQNSNFLFLNWNCPPPLPLLLHRKSRCRSPRGWNRWRGALRSVIFHTRSLR